MQHAGSVFASLLSQQIELFRLNVDGHMRFYHFLCFVECPMGLYFCVVIYVMIGKCKSRKNYIMGS